MLPDTELNPARWVGPDVYNGCKVYRDSLHTGLRPWLVVFPNGECRRFETLSNAYYSVVNREKADE